MDISSPVLFGLIRKRKEIASELDAAQSKVRELLFEIDCLDTTIRLFQPCVELSTI